MKVLPSFLAAMIPVWMSGFTDFDRFLTSISSSEASWAELRWPSTFRYLSACSRLVPRWAVLSVISFSSAFAVESLLAMA